MKIKHEIKLEHYKERKQERKWSWSENQDT
jgi:hypothetical protein